MPKPGFSPSLPLEYDIDGPYSMLLEVGNMVKQNLKMLLLTAPGERVMIPEYGVGLRNYLFLQNNIEARYEIQSAVNEQIKIFMPFLENVVVAAEQMASDENAIAVRVSYRIGPIDQEDYLDLVLSPKISNSI